MSAPPLLDQIVSRAAEANCQLSDEQAGQLVAYYTLLERWNQKINLTALPLAARSNSTLDRLIVEPLIAAKAILDSELVWFDVGSGGGSPAVPLKIMRPHLTLRMVEARSRKAAFLREAVSSLGLKVTEVLSSRIENVGADPTVVGMAQLLTIRAVRLDQAVLGAARNILGLGGLLLLFQGAAGTEVQLEGFEQEARRSLNPSTGFLSTFRKTS